MTCPALTSLIARNAEELFSAHFAECRRCRALRTRFAAEEVVESEKMGAIAQVQRAVAAPRPGDVWTFWSPNAAEYTVGTVLEADETEVLIVPVLMETGWASEVDVILEQDALGYEALLAVWAGDRVLREQTAEPVGVLSEGDFGLISSSYEAFFSSEPLPRPGGVPVASDDDPRLVAHAAAADTLRGLYEPWATLEVGDELGPVIAERRENVEFDPDDIGINLRTWTRFEEGRADPYREIPPAKLAEAIELLGLLPSRRVLDLARASVCAHYVDDVLASPAKARRRRGVSGSGVRRRPEAAGEVADEYVAALAGHLGL